MKKKQCVIVFLVLLVIFANVIAAKTQKKKEVKAKIKGKGKGKEKGVPTRSKISSINYWTPKGKSKNQIDEAYYCVERNLWKELCCYIGSDINKGTRDLFKVLY